MTHEKSALDGIASFWVSKRPLETGSGCRTLKMPSIQLADGDKVEKGSNQTVDRVWEYEKPVSGLLVSSSLTECFAYTAKNFCNVYSLLFINPAN